MYGKKKYTTLPRLVKDDTAIMNYKQWMHKSKVVQAEINGNDKWNKRIMWA